MNYHLTLTEDASQLLWVAGSICLNEEHRTIFFDGEKNRGVPLSQLEQIAPQFCRTVRVLQPESGEIKPTLILKCLGSTQHLKDGLEMAQAKVSFLGTRMIIITDDDRSKFFYSDLLMLATLATLTQTTVGWLATAESGLIRFENLVIAPNLEVTAGDEVLLHWGVIVERADRVPDFGWTVESIDHFLADNLPNFHKGRWQSWVPKKHIVIDFRNLGGFNFTELNEDRLY